MIVIKSFSGIFIFTSIILFALAGCSHRQPLDEMDAKESYRYLEKRFEKKAYADAVEGLGFFALNHSGSAQVDSAQFLLAQAHFKLKEYLLAADSYEELVRRFPNSPLAPEATYRIGICYWELSPKYSLDQEFSFKAIDAFQTFIDYYPEWTERTQEAQDYIEHSREKLAHKRYANGLIYMKMKNFPAAVIYFQGVVDEYYDTSWAPLSSYNLAVCHEKDNHPEDAVEAYKTFLSKYPDHPLTDKAETASGNLHKQLKNQE